MDLSVGSTGELVLSGKNYQTPTVARHIRIPGERGWRHRAAATTSASCNSAERASLAMLLAHNKNAVTTIAAAHGSVNRLRMAPS